VHDVKKLEDLLEAKILEAPYDQEENLCLDAGYVGDNADLIITGFGYIPHVRPRGEEKKEIEKNPDFKARRWIVEVAHSWFNRFRKILVRFEKKTKNYLALLHLAASMICWRKIDVIYG
jgi:transposase